MNGPAWNHRRLEANGIGIHFAHYERPDLASREISNYFRAIA
jgi:hypothetical protein